MNENTKEHIEDFVKQINVKSLKKQTGVLNNFRIIDVIMKSWERMEVPFYYFFDTVDITLEEEEFTVVGILLKEKTIEELKNGKLYFHLQLGVTNPENNTIEHGPVMEVEYKISDLVKIDSGNWRKPLSFVQLETVLLLHKLYSLGALNTLKNQYEVNKIV